jgi:PAS domain S-box-containing protein
MEDISKTPNFLQTVLNSIQDSIKIIDRDFNILFTNKKGEDIAKKLSKDMIGKKCYEEFYHTGEECAFCVTQKVFDTGEPADITYTAKKNGKPRLMEISVYPLKNVEGGIGWAVEIVRDITELRKEIASESIFANIISEDEKMQEVFQLIGSVAKTDSTVLIKGETGTGKELVARAIHLHSKRKDRKFVAINCGAITDTLLESELFGHEKGAFTGADVRRIGKFELANNGTIFLDEIGNISEAMQVKILRVLQEGELSRVGGNDLIHVNVRVIAATNIDLEEAVKDRKFREDLFYRINVIPIELPPLRERKGDIPLLSNYFLEYYREQIGKDVRTISKDAMNSMIKYSWPGNVRELKNLIERAVILAKGKEITSIDIPSFKRGRMSEDTGVQLKEWAKIYEKDYLSKILRQYKGNLSLSAEHAGIDTRTLYRKMKEYNLQKEEYK